MALTWLDLARNIEAYYMRAVGGSSADETLRLALVPWANDAMNEIQKMRRWSLAYGTGTVTTIPGTAVYPIPVGIDPISVVYWLDASGYPNIIERYAPIQGRLRMGEGSASSPGQPLEYSLEGRNIQLFPVPDSGGPVSGNYVLVFEGYQKLTQVPLIETTGSITSATTLLTVPSAVYISTRNNGGLSATTGFAIRGAGAPGPNGVADDMLSTFLSSPNDTTINLAAAPVCVTTVSNAQTFVNPVNWLIQDYPKALEFAVLREVASRLKDDYQKWESRYQHEIDLMIDADFDRQRTLELLLTYNAAQRAPQLRRLDQNLGIEVRGGVI